MARLFGSKDGNKIDREYHKQDAAHWDQPSLADVIQAQIGDGIGYDELRALAIELGYANTTFRQVMSALYSEGAIEKRNGGVFLCDEYTGEDWI